MRSWGMIHITASASLYRDTNSVSSLLSINQIFHASRSGPGGWDSPQTNPNVMETQHIAEDNTERFLQQ